MTDDTLDRHDPRFAALSPAALLERAIADNATQRNQVDTLTAQVAAYRPALAELTDASRRLVETFDALDKAHGFGHLDLDRSLTHVRDAIRRAGDAHLKATGRCRCDWQSGAVHDHNSLFCVDSAVASVPPVAREEWASGGIVAGPVLPVLPFGAGCVLGDRHAARQMLSPGRPVDALPDAGRWGPYELESDVWAEPLPVAVDTLLRMEGLGEPTTLIHTTAQAHLESMFAACRMARGAYDQLVVEWLARNVGVGVVQVLIGWVRRAYATGEHVGREDLAAVVRERDSLARRCGVRFEEAEKLRAELAAMTEARNVLHDRLAAAEELPIDSPEMAVVRAAIAWRQEAVVVGPSIAGTEEDLALIRAVDALPAPEDEGLAPCQPLGCDAGHHLDGCQYAQTDEDAAVEAADDAEARRTGGTFAQRYLGGRQ